MNDIVRKRHTLRHGTDVRMQDDGTTTSAHYYLLRGVCVWDPFTDESGIEAVDPIEYYGLTRDEVIDLATRNNLPIPAELEVL